MSYTPVDPVVARTNHSRAARLRWEKLRPVVAARQKARREEKEAKYQRWLAARALSKAGFPERNRQRALADYHCNADRINDLRRFPGVYRTALRNAERRPVEQAQRRTELEHAMRKVFTRARNQAEQKIRRALRRRFEKAMKHRHHSSVIYTMTGTTLAGVRAHLEGQFKPGMSWDTYGYEGWHIDHIKPVASFAPADPAAWHYTNLQPLWMAENLAKSDHLTEGGPCATF